MWMILVPLAFCASLAITDVRADVLQPPVSKGDSACLEKRIADLELRLTLMQKELQDLRRGLPAQAALTPEEAVKSSKENPTKRLTVEFGVESAGWPDGPIRVGEDPMPPIMADWDGRLSNGGKFTLLLTAEAVRGLKDIGFDLPPAMPMGLVDLNRLDQVCKHLKGKGIRVSGLVRASRPGDRYTDYFITVDAPDHFAVIK